MSNWNFQSLQQQGIESYEKNGIEYYFLTVSEFKKRIANGDLSRMGKVYENLGCGTLKSEIERIWTKGYALFDVDVKGGINLKDST